MKIVILVENRKEQNECLNEEGLSIYVEIDSNKFLIDAGITDAYLTNAKLLNIDLDSIEKMVLSHGHWDHGNGFKYLSQTKNKTIILHPDCFLDRYSSRRDMEYAGINQKLDEMTKKYNIIQTVNSYEIFDNVWYLGQIDRNNDFEGKKFPTVLENNEIDYLNDDSGVAIKTQRGIIVISSCAHSGICNTIEYAKKITGENKVLAVIGGFHLNEIDELLEKTIEYFKENIIDNIYVGHCTSDEVLNEFEKKLKDTCNIEKLYSGKIIEID